ncbi:MAG: YggT family protein [Candidatus Limnocylindria bacterium]
MRDPGDPTERVERTDRVVERTDRTVERPVAPVAPGVTSPQTNVNVAGTGTTAAPAYSPAWGVARVVTLIFTVIEILLLLRFILRLAGANADQPLVSALYGVTEPLTRPFQGIFPTPSGTPVFDVAALLAILFFFLVGAFIVALTRAISGRAAA